MHPIPSQRTTTGLLPEPQKPAAAPVTSDTDSQQQLVDEALDSFPEAKALFIALHPAGSQSDPSFKESVQATAACMAGVRFLDSLVKPGPDWTQV